MVWFTITDTYEKPSAQISYSGVQSTDHPIKFYASINGGMAEYSWLWDFGDGDTSTEKNPTHIYKNHGEYDITLTVTDGLGQKSIDEVKDLIIIPNQSPDKPDRPNGPTNIQINIQYGYKSYTEDHEKDKVYYLFDWGDGTDSGWLGPYTSGEECEAFHSWDKKGVYEITVKSKDEFEAESEWSDPLSVSLPRCRVWFYSMINWLGQRFPNLLKFFTLP